MRLWFSGAIWIAGFVAWGQVPPPPGNDIPSFVTCLNGRLPKTTPANVAGAVACIPDGCKVTVTMSDRSAQEACFASPTLKVGQLPRVIFSCPGPAATPWQRFRPSFLLCPVGSQAAGGQLGTNRVEIGADQQPIVVNKKAAINMQMADIPIPPEPWREIVNINTVLNNNGLPQGQNAKGCNGRCHVSAPGFPGNSQVVDSYGVFTRGNDPPIFLRPFIIHTDEPNKLPLVNPTIPGTKKQDLAAICADPNFLGNPTLCNNLRVYQTDRSCRTAVQGGFPVVCAGLNGGGLFLSGNPAILGDGIFLPGDDPGNVPSAVSFDVSGWVRKPNASTFQFLDTEGALSAFNYGTRTMVTSVKLTLPLVLTTSALGYTVSGLGEAQVSVNGGAPVLTNIVLSITTVRTPLKFLITKAAGGDFLAGGIARPPADIVRTGFN